MLAGRRASEILGLRRAWGTPCWTCVRSLLGPPPGAGIVERSRRPAAGYVGSERARPRFIRAAVPRRLDTAMYVSLSHLRVTETRAAELVAAFRGRAHLVDEVDGFVDLEVWQSDRDAGELVMV